jgi:hypothetical protein
VPNVLVHKRLGITTQFVSQNYHQDYLDEQNGDVFAFSTCVAINLSCPSVEIHASIHLRPSARLRKGGP